MISIMPQASPSHIVDAAYLLLPLRHPHQTTVAQVLPSYNFLLPFGILTSQYKVKAAAMLNAM